ncbi:MAG: hypothetical protein HQK60_03835 [Deltaproteobacteria bacterium]|nr:hypothetical protein [Deltaproteobacteria bacterium]
MNNVSIARWTVPKTKKALVGWSTQGFFLNYPNSAQGQTYPGIKIKKESPPIGIDRVAGLLDY